MKFFNKIPNIASMRSFKNHFLQCLTNGDLYYNDNLIAKEVEAQSYRLQNNYVFFHDEQGKHCYLNLKTQEIFKNNFAVAYPYIDKNHILCHFDMDYRADGNSQWKTGLLHISSQKIVKVFDLFSNKTFIYADKNFAITYERDNKFGKYSFVENKYSWNVCLDLPRTPRILGIEGEKLIFTYEGDMVIYICALNIHTGVMIWHRDAGGLDPHTALLVPKKGTVISLKSRRPNSNTFIEMSLETGETLRVGSLPELEKADLQVVRSVLHGNALYFTANHDGSFGDVAIGVLDFKTLHLQWWEAVEMEQPGSNFFVGAGLVIAGNQLYVQDKTNVLHIYEKKPSFRFKSFKTTALVPIEPEIIYERTPEVIFNKDCDHDLPF